MLKKLRQNPCDFPDFVVNRDVANVPERLEDKVEGAPRHACAYWAAHVRSSPTYNDHATRLINSAVEFFEVMSLENRLESVIHNINNLIDWLGTVCELSDD